MRHRIGIAVEPPLLRSALQAALSRDGRLEPFAIDATAEGHAAVSAPGAGGIVVSDGVTQHGSLVVRLLDTQVELRRGAFTRTLPYLGLAWLADVLVAELASGEVEASAQEAPPL